MRVLLATRNRHKVDELRRILSAAELTAEVLDLDDTHVPNTPETGVTFEENALLKARAAAAASGLPVIADDSGLSVDILGGMPGIFSARWSGPSGDDAANLALVLAQVQDIAAEHRTARFVCAAAAVWPDAAWPQAAGGLPSPVGAGWWELVVTGEVRGRLTAAPRGENGFGYDPIFEVIEDGRPTTTAELPAWRKDEISHRGRAFRLLVDRLAGRSA